MAPCRYVTTIPTCILFDLASRSKTEVHLYHMKIVEPHSAKQITNPHWYFFVTVAHGDCPFSQKTFAILVLS